MRIALTGASSTGKTTLTNELLKDYPQFEQINMNARELLKKHGCLNTGDMNADQYKRFQNAYINNKQLLEQGKTNYFTERSFVDAYVYWNYHCSDCSSASEKKQIYTICKKWANRYNLHIYLPFGSIPFVEDGYRHSSLEYHQCIDQAIRATLHEWKLNFIECSSPNLSDRIDTCRNGLIFCKN